MGVHRQLAVLLGATALSGAAGVAAAASPPVVTVTARPPPSATLNRETYNFVNAIAVQAPGESLVRWSRAICPYAVGLNADANAAIAQEVAQIAAAAGAPVATTDCAPNLVVVATDQPGALLDAWRKRDANLFGDSLPADIDRFLTDRRPVRVWYNPLRSTVDGEAIAEGPRVYSGETTIYSYGSSRLRYKTLLGLQSAIVVVDLRRAGGLSIRQIADYAAMAALTEIRLDADVGDAPTILRLFQAAADARPAGLTDWDKGYLAGAYGSDQSSKVQRSAIAASVSAAASGSTPSNP